MIRNKNVLGISTRLEDEEILPDFANVVEITTTLRRKDETAVGTRTYELVARLIDYNGNIQELIISNLRIVDKFKVINSLNNAHRGCSNTALLLQCSVESLQTMA